MLANRVREYTVTVGTGNITLGGALAGHVRFADAFVAGDSVIYVLEDGDNYEIGTGTLVDAGTLARTKVEETLVGGVRATGTPAAISLSGGARIYCAVSAAYLLNPEKEADLIREMTPDAGVLVDGVHMKDSKITAQNATFSGSMTVSGVVVAQGAGIIFDSHVIQDAMVGTRPVHWQKQATKYILQSGGVGNIVEYDLDLRSTTFIGNVGVAGSLTGTFGSFSNRLTVTTEVGVPQGGLFTTLNTTGTYVSWAGTGGVVGDIGHGSQVISGGNVADFAISSRAGNLVLGTNTTSRLVITDTTSTFSGDVSVNSRTTQLGDNTDIGPLLQFKANRLGVNQSLGSIDGLWNGNRVSLIEHQTGIDTINKDDGNIVFYTQNNTVGGLVESLRIDENQNALFSGAVRLGTPNTTYTNSISMKSAGSAATAFALESDINTSVIARLSSGASSGGQFKLYNSAGTQNIFLDGETGDAIFSGNVVATRLRSIGTGSEANPALSNDADQDTGMYFRGTNQLGWTVGGSDGMWLDSTQLRLAAGVKLTVDGGAKISVQNAVDGGSGQGIFWWDTDNTNYGTYIATSGAGKSLSGGTACAALDSGGLTNTNIRMRTFNAAGQGFIWENSSEQCLASLTADIGDFYTKGNVNAGGQVVAPLGSAASPAYQLGALGTGIYGAGTNVVAIATNGIARATFGDSWMHLQGNALDGVGTITSANGLMHQDISTGTMEIYGSNAVNSGGGVKLYGSTHATKASDTEFSSDGTPWLHHDKSTSTVDFQSNALSGVGAVTLSGATITRDINTDGLTVSGGPAASTGAAIQLFGTTAAGIAGDIYFNVDGGTVLQWDNSLLNWDFKGNALTGVDEIQLSGSRIIRDGPTGVLGISGGSHQDLGANITLYGESHATNANDIFFRAGTNDVGTYDSSAYLWNWRGNAFTNVGDISMSGDRIQRSVNTSTLLLIAGTVQGEGANIELFGGSHATRGSGIAFTAAGAESLSYDASATTWDFKGNLLTGVGDISISGATIKRNVDTSALVYSGGSSDVNGANLALFGGTHATLANDFALRAGSSNVIYYDDSASTVDFQANAITTTGAINANGLFSLGSPTELTIATGVVTITKAFHTVGTEAAAATDDLATVTAAAAGTEITFSGTANAATQVVTFKDGTGNLQLAGDFVLNTVNSTIKLISDGTNWRELSRSSNT